MFDDETGKHARRGEGELADGMRWDGIIGMKDDKHGTMGRDGRVEAREEGTDLGRIRKMECSEQRAH